MATPSNRFPALHVLATVIEVLAYIMGIGWAVAGILASLQAWGFMRLAAILVGIVIGILYTVVLKALAELIRLLLHIESNSFVSASWLARIGEALQRKEGQQQ